MVFFMLVQTTAIFGSLVFGFITDRIGPKRTIVLTLMIWFGVVLLAVFADSKELFFRRVCLPVWPCGSSQAASRSMMAKLTPVNMLRSFSVFMTGPSESHRYSGSPAFGMVSAQASSQKVALASLLVFFGAGLLLMLRVRSSSVSGRPAVQKS